MRWVRRMVPKIEMDGEERKKGRRNSRQGRFIRGTLLAFSYLDLFLYPLRLSRPMFPIAFDMELGIHCSLASSSCAFFAFVFFFSSTPFFVFVLLYLYTDTLPFLPTRNKRFSLFEFCRTIIEGGEI